MSVRCPNCGKEDLPEKSQFCFSCGFNVVPIKDIPADKYFPAPDSQDVTIEVVAISQLLPWLRDKQGQMTKDEIVKAIVEAEAAGDRLTQSANFSSDNNNDEEFDAGFETAKPQARNTREHPSVPDTSDEDAQFGMIMPDARDTQESSFVSEAEDDDAKFGMTMTDARDTQESGFLESSFVSDLGSEGAGGAGFTVTMPDAKDTETGPLVSDATSSINGENSESREQLTATKPHVPSSESSSRSRDGRTGTTQPGSFTVDFTHNLGETLQNRYRLDELLGRGGYGAAYLAQDIRLKRICVVKQMLNKKGASPSQLEEQRANFAKEASLLVQLNHPGHPNIGPEIYDYFYDDTGNYLVMKYIEGQNLKQVIDQNNGKIPWRDAVRYTIDVCSALDYIHTQGSEPVTHRDIKPANILLGNDNRIWLIDFGLAKEDPLEQGTRQIDTRAAGSIGYAPLEQWFGEAEPASDIYAVGATLHHMVTGLNPLRAFDGKFDIQKIHELHGNFVPIRQVDQKLPQRLEEVIVRATASEPADRPNARLFQQQLQVVLSGTQGAALYTFKNRQSAKTVEELVDLCEKNRIEAQSYLYNGDFEQWFLFLNHNELAEAAALAVELENNEKDGLEKFLRLILPNLLFRRLTRMGWRVARFAALIFTVFLIAAALIAVGSSYVIGQFVEQTIDQGVSWTFSIKDLGKEQVYEETYLEEKFNEAAGTYFDDIQVQINPPDQINVNTTWNGFPIKTTFSVRLAQNQPRFYIVAVNGLPLYPVTNNISSGINNGVEAAFRRGPVDVSSLLFREGRVIFTIEEARKFGGDSPRPTLALPTPTFTPLPPTPIPTATPTPVKFTLVVLFNDLNEDVNIEIQGQTVEGNVWATSLPIPANRTEVIEPPAGSYTYTVTYLSDGEWAAGGIENWVLKQAYRVRIVDFEPTPTPSTTPGVESRLNN